MGFAVPSASDFSLEGNVKPYWQANNENKIRWYIRDALRADEAARSEATQDVEPEPWPQSGLRGADRLGLAWPDGAVSFFW